MQVAMTPSGMETTSPLISFEIVPYPEITPRDVEDIEKAIAGDRLGMNMSTIHHEVKNGEVTVWRYTSPEGRGIVLTKTTRGTDESELFIWYLAGRGFAPNGRYISAVLEEYCRLNGMRRITGLVGPVMKRALEKFGYKASRYLISKEVSNGQR